MTSQLSDNDIEAELSYAYLHAVASIAGADCKSMSRLSDNRGLDAQLTAWGPFPGGGDRLEVDLKIQLKATVSAPNDIGSHFSYHLKDIKRYNDLRQKAYSVPRVLVVLYLPKKKTDWLLASENDLSLKKCAYWVSLVGAKESSNKSGITVYLPKEQILTPETLSSLFTSLSHGICPEYIDPRQEP
ncbi:DUF4365 domain-containing protein [Undibacterium sp. TC4M20W]|uniref:DUF4365 domain-containing protein n=1 Tax=Undibacterium sp. TC4M20W TaxID=3413052 RepID=UPI003BF21900